MDVTEVREREIGYMRKWNDDPCSVGEQCAEMGFQKALRKWWRDSKSLHPYVVWESCFFVMVETNVFVDLRNGAGLMRKRQNL